ncbi:hypothetical protein N3K66_007167 [Trichothecium roseum]|uniref:Uncharacterized protein n=1 Tax=Trichothecium roseum TaxID=47278 RepID=A0ACC0UT79_9HYPO|nr:hypothetical protein N3K66_007167 [Trichothecium roseum]
MASAPDIPTHTAGPKDSSNKLDNKQSSPKINFGINRLLVLMSHDFRNRTLLALDRVSKLTEGELAEFKKSIARGRTTLQRSKILNLRLTEAEGDRARASKSGVIKRSTQETAEIAKYPYGRLQKIHQQSTTDYSIVVPNDPASWLTWYYGDNPSFIRVLEICFHVVLNKKERVLIYVDTPWIQLLTVEALTAAGFATQTIRPTDTTKDRTDIINTFNNPTTQTNILITNINSLAFGVNLHRAYIAPAQSLVFPDIPYLYTEILIWEVLKANKYLPIFQKAGQEAKAREELDNIVKTRIAERRKHASRRKEQGYQHDENGQDVDNVEDAEEEVNVNEDPNDIELYNTIERERADEEEEEAENESNPSSLEVVDNSKCLEGEDNTSEVSSQAGETISPRPSSPGSPIPQVAKRKASNKARDTSTEPANKKIKLILRGKKVGGGKE